MILGLIAISGAVAIASLIYTGLEFYDYGRLTPTAMLYTVCAAVCTAVALGLVLIK